VIEYVTADPYVCCASINSRSNSVHNSCLFISRLAACYCYHCTRGIQEIAYCHVNCVFTTSAYYYYVLVYYGCITVYLAMTCIHAVCCQQEPAKPKSSWRQKHEDFVRTIRAARGAQAAMDRGEPLPPPPPPSYNPGRQFIDPRWVILRRTVSLSSLGSHASLLSLACGDLHVPQTWLQIEGWDYSVAGPRLTSESLTVFNSCLKDSLVCRIIRQLNCQWCYTPAIVRRPCSWLWCRRINHCHIIVCNRWV